MVRTQIQLTEEQSRSLHETARHAGLSVAEVIRRTVDRYLDQEAAPTTGQATREAAAQMIGLFHSGRSDVATRHDDYLDEAYAG
jgi:hypothetical protein